MLFIMLLEGSNYGVYWWIPKVQPFKQKLLNSTFLSVLLIILYGMF